MTEAAKGRLLLLWVGFASFFLMGGIQSLYGPALPMLARETGRAVADVSILFTVHWIGSALGVAAMFVQGDRVTPRMVVVLLALGAGLLGAGLGWPMTLVGATLAGFGQGCGAVVFNPRLLAAFGPRGPAMLSLINAIFGAGAILAPMALVLVGGAYGLVFLAVAAGLVLLAIGARDEGRIARHEAAGPLRADWVILAFGACGVGMEASLIGLGPAALVRSGATEVQGAEAMSAFFLAFLIGRMALTLVAHAIRPFTVYLLATSGIAICMILATVIPPYWLFALSGAFAGIVFPSYFVAGSQRMGQNPRVSPLIIAGGLVGGISLPFILAHVTETMGPRGFFQIMAVLAVLVSLVALAAMLSERAATRRAGLRP
ncbi:MFS transporter [Gemmobacter serpentinus]|uniref:MFS transporter n=1 Tax=Gemmobacter serpentinus TaxID=2652247 RepID=UPI00186574BF|nr:MFS transporter [Gemmobacter serpentinus]